MRAHSPPLTLVEEKYLGYYLLSFFLSAEKGPKQDIWIDSLEKRNQKRILSWKRSGSPDGKGRREKMTEKPFWVDSRGS